MSNTRPWSARAAVVGVLAVMALLSLPACGSGSESPDSTTGTGVEDTSDTRDSAPPSTVPGPTVPTSTVPEPIPPQDTSPTTPAAPPPPTLQDAPPTTIAKNDTAGPRFNAVVEPVPAPVRARMDGVSMRPGCPVGYDALRYLTLSYWGFDGRAHQGEMVVNAQVADDVVAIFEGLFEMRFPITRMQLVDDFGPGATAMDGADDFASIEADNTSAFNCRARVGSGSSYSEHSYGWAIDLNPLINPYVRGDGRTAHTGSVRYLKRDPNVPGLITNGDAVVQLFAAHGWGWGGLWSSIKDYQHFSLTGR